MQNKNIVIIGASSGIGKALGSQLISAGANVYSFSRNTPDYQVTNHQTFDVNLPDISLLSSLPEQIHGLVYCPGSMNFKPFNRFSNEDFQKDFQLNVLGAIGVIQQLVSKLKAASGASVVLFSTVAVQTGMAFHASISVSKGAIEGLTRSLAAEYASANIRINALAPSLTNTPLASSLLSTPEKIENSNKRHPLNKIGSAEEIAAFAAFLLSDNASWMTGQIIKVDGGLSVIK